MQDNRLDFDLAPLALKGKRFKEADERYINNAQKQNSDVACCGLSFSKFGH